MEVLYSRCCGLDVHKSSITASAQAQHENKEIRSRSNLICKKFPEPVIR
jgi:hypothetical protein